MIQNGLRPIYELYMNYIWTTYELHMNYIWTTYELYMNYIWTIYELYMNYIWTIYTMKYHHITHWIADLASEHGPRDTHGPRRSASTDLDVSPRALKVSSCRELHRWWKLMETPKKKATGYTQNDDLTIHHQSPVRP